MTFTAKTKEAIDAMDDDLAKTFLTKLYDLIGLDEWAEIPSKVSYDISSKDLYDIYNKLSIEENEKVIDFLTKEIKATVFDTKGLAEIKILDPAGMLEIIMNK